MLLSVFLLILFRLGLSSAQAVLLTEFATIPRKISNSRTQNSILDKTSIVYQYSFLFVHDRARWSLARQQTHPRQLRSESVVILFLTVLRLYVGLHALCKFGRACIQKRVNNIYAPYAALDHSLTIIITMFRRIRAFLFAAMTLAQLGVCTSQIGEYI